MKPKNFIRDLFDSDPDNRPQYINEALERLRKKMIKDGRHEKMYNQIPGIRKENERMDNK